VLVIFECLQYFRRVVVVRAGIFMIGWIFQLYSALHLQLLHHFTLHPYLITGRRFEYEHSYRCSDESWVDYLANPTLNPEISGWNSPLGDAGYFIPPLRITPTCLRTSQI
jgi:hypothetical protein